MTALTRRDFFNVIIWVNITLVFTLCQYYTLTSGSEWNDEIDCGGFELKIKEQYTEYIDKCKLVLLVSCVMLYLVHVQITIVLFYSETLKWMLKYSIAIGMIAVVCKMCTMMLLFFLVMHDLPMVCVHVELLRPYFYILYSIEIISWLFTLVYTIIGLTNRNRR